MLRRPESVLVFVFVIRSKDQKGLAGHTYLYRIRWKDRAREEKAKEKEKRGQISMIIGAPCISSRIVRDKIRRHTSSQREGGKGGKGGKGERGGRGKLKGMVVTRQNIVNAI